jgi:hypothetical protein
VTPSKAETEKELKQVTEAKPDATDAIEVVKSDVKKQSTEDFMLRSPAGALTPLARDESTAVLSMLNYCGLWTIGTDDALQKDPWLPQAVDGQTAERESTQRDSAQVLASDDPQLVRVACNLCNREESDLKPRVKLETPSDFGMLSLGGRSIWFYLVLAGLMLVAIEWWLYQRRVVG